LLNLVRQPERSFILATSTHDNIPGLRENWRQFSLLVLVNAFVGATVGMERSILPAMAEHEFQLATHTAILSFIVVFGLSKALTNYYAGRFSDSYGRKRILVAGWVLAAPVPFMLMWAPSWNWVLMANLLLGISQGLTWSMTVIMKIDLAGPRQRGLAMGINEFAGYVAVGLAALATGWIAGHYGLSPAPFYLGVAFVLAGLFLSIFSVRETHHHAKHEASRQHPDQKNSRAPSPRTIFWNTTLHDRNLSSVSQVGLVNNLNDGMAWGLFPLVFATAGLGLDQIGWIAAIYPGTWGICQLFTGALSDRIGRKWLIVSGMWVQAAGIGIIATTSAFDSFIAGAIFMGIGTAMVYPTLLATIGDVVNPAWRASAVGVYRLWRDLGYAVGALLSGLVADLFGMASALWVVAGLTMLSGTLAAFRMQETRIWKIEDYNPLGRSSSE
jgi:MFS family permease